MGRSNQVVASVRVRLQTSPQQTEQLRRLQAEFAKACNSLAPLVQSTAVWNRVALHHMAYRTLRQQFPGLGSQMACNAIYSVSRTCRVVYQNPNSPFNVQRMRGRPLPLLSFSEQSPVYFDRHTLSVKDGQASMYTLDGRMRFQLRLAAEDERRFREERLREIVLLRAGIGFDLLFTFGADAPSASLGSEAASADTPSLPAYIEVHDTHNGKAPTGALPLVYDAHLATTSGSIRVAPDTPLLP